MPEHERLPGRRVDDSAGPEWAIVLEVAGLAEQELGHKVALRLILNLKDR